MRVFDFFFLGFACGQVNGGHRPHLSKNWPPQFVNLLTAGWHPDMYQRMSFEEIVATLRRWVTYGAFFGSPRVCISPEELRGCLSSLMPGRAGVQGRSFVAAR